MAASSDDLAFPHLTLNSFLIQPVSLCASVHFLPNGPSKSVQNSKAGPSEIPILILAIEFPISNHH
ncbi:hypothetical protein CCACVL1_24345 [Corchorus capsularis]|uniref:Uncharacterized protein n=1 Tax=Corchorus capsularis TaxID=210143 RepID=A0A1R3GPY9_COCAP|nr:hypothetical protein CCACVL1_24345 [Corchorus capsularis]